MCAWNYLFLIHFHDNVDFQVFEHEEYSNVIYFIISHLIALWLIKFYIIRFLV